MKVSERIDALRALMAREGIDAYLVPSADNHQSEYVGEHFKSRAFITGFTGSAGDCVITKDEAGMWTDARYFIQAEKQMKDTGVKLYKMGEPGFPSMTEFLEKVLPAGGTLGFDGRVVAMQEGQDYEELLSGKNVNIKYDVDLIAEIWNDRPPLSEKKAFVLEEKYAGESVASKLERIRTEMEKEGANLHVLTTLDDICWIINLRGDDIEYSPMVLSYAIITLEGMELFIDERKLDDSCKAHLASNHITLHPYNDIYEAVKKFTSQDTLLLDPAKLNYALYNNIPQDVAKVERPNPSVLFKAIKNETEIANMKKAQIKDGVALVRFMKWMKENAGKEKITELSASDKLEEFRKMGEGYLWQSFEPICSYKENAAIVHYTATPETDKEVFAEGMFLADTGGNYYEGSTDITRTFVLGDITDEMKFHFTTVCRSMLNLASAKFLYGCHGYNLDILARQPLWDLDMNFKHGTGHGIGYLLSIHEGPAGFRWQVVPGKNEQHVIEPGMVLTDEPGIYIEGSHGIRTENELLAVNGIANDFGQFMHFETLSFVPIDLDGIDPEALRAEERAHLNAYHLEVYDKLSPYLDDEEKSWLKKYTREI